MKRHLNNCLPADVVLIDDRVDSGGGSEKLQAERGLRRPPAKVCVTIVSVSGLTAKTKVGGDRSSARISSLFSFNDGSGGIGPLPNLTLVVVDEAHHFDSVSAKPMLKDTDKEYYQQQQPQMQDDRGTWHSTLTALESKADKHSIGRFTVGLTATPIMVRDDDRMRDVPYYGRFGNLLHEISLETMVRPAVDPETGVSTRRLCPIKEVCLKPRRIPNYECTPTLPTAALHLRCL